MKKSLKTTGEVGGEEEPKPVKNWKSVCFQVYTAHLTELRREEKRGKGSRLITVAEEGDHE